MKQKTLVMALAGAGLAWWWFKGRQAGAGSTYSAWSPPPPQSSYWVETRDSSGWTGSPF